jgi:hypothetical protein
MRIVGAPVAGNALASVGETVAPVFAGTTTFGVAVTPVAATTAVGFGGALRTGGAMLIGAVNSLIESTPALIVWSDIERAEVIVSTYAPPGTRAVEVLITAIFGLIVEPVIDDTLMLSLVDWSMIRIRIDSIRIDWLNPRERACVVFTSTVSRKSGSGELVVSVGAIPVAVSAAIAVENTSDDTIIATT